MPIIKIKDASTSFLHHSQYIQIFVQEIYEKLLPYFFREMNFRNYPSPSFIFNILL